jgi:RNA 2',3'-cyclic 3'-phosphodiesterase
MKRIFIAVKVVAGAKFLKLISTFKEHLSAESIKWISIENIHITLAFPGNTSDEKIRVIEELLGERCGEFKRFEAVIRGTGVFKSMNDPKILWAGIEQSKNMSELSRVIINDLKKIDIELEDRPFNPHITIGRIKHLTGKEEFRNLISNFQSTEIQVVPVNEVTLYESILLPAGPVYKPVGVYPLSEE